MNRPNGTPTVRGTMHPRFDEIVTPEALAFVAKLDSEFAGRRAELLQARRQHSRRINQGADLDFLPETKSIREDDTWQVAPPAPGLHDRRCEMVSPANRKMAVHALNSGANVWLADLEDATAPTWQNIIAGQVNLFDAVRGQLTYDESNGEKLSVGEHRPTLVMRPRGWHLCEKHITIDSRPMSATLVDFGLYFFHNAQKLIDLGAGPYFYLPKIENHHEARLWNDVFVFAQNELGIPQGTIRATVLIETITSAFEMDEILYELREHSSGLNAGRWDYIFSYVRTFAQRGEEFVLPDRDKVTMTTPFMRAYTQLLVDTCHKRGAHAIGGPAAVNPTLQDEERRLRALNVVRAEKEREASEGFDGSWVAHPALVETCQVAYAGVLGGKDDQRDLRPSISVTATDLVSLDGVQQTISLQGVRTNVSVALRYLAAWIGGRGAVAIDTLMEDAATVEISRAQLWQWLRHESQLAEGPFVTRDLLDRVVEEEMTKLTRGLDDRHTERYQQARGVLEETAFGDYLPGFFTTYAYVRYLIDRPLRISGPIDKEDIRQSENVGGPVGATSAA
ncbi:malate synthase A [Yimella sp. cx-51]|uniref:malate synthase A n=1 Tax=Yimella sp. cx-51 TaxID=2770551 RepID=UPI00165E84D0|nr:malate synthase A [Yimella sp. cx-51]MBC9956753.1 malate synthase A [Yimella sp. cx-51]MBD2759180.1 malate synthase A [Yimella sp. cx-573]QTH38989.1 malate synthase A [Yimella sp. cx-51]